MYSYLIILCINSIIATPGYTYIDYEHGGAQENVSTSVPIASIINGQSTTSNTKTTDTISISTTPTHTQSISNQETPCDFSATTILSTPSSNYMTQLPTAQPTKATSTSTFMSTSINLADSDLQGNSSNSINDQQPALIIENFKITANTNESAMENINQNPRPTSYSASSIEVMPPNSALININSQSVLKNTTPTISTNSTPTPAVDSITQDSGFYGDNDNELEYLQQQAHDSNGSIDSNNQLDNDDEEVVLTTNNNIIYGYGYDNTLYE